MGAPTASRSGARGASADAPDAAVAAFTSVAGAAGVLPSGTFSAPERWQAAPKQQSTRAIEPSFTIEPDDLTVEADRDHLSRILINLVENAAKYAVGSPVELYAWERPSKAVIAVVDHGPGIPDEEKDRVFERFTQIDQSDTRSKGGTGLGLSIVKSLAEVMRGAVRVEATEGGGATFVVELPLAPSMLRADRR